MKFLLATDGSNYSEAASKMLDVFRFGVNDTIKIISVIDMALPMAMDIYGGYLPDTTEIEKLARENAEKIVDSLAQTLTEKYKDQSPRISTEVLFGSPDSRIVETAEEFRADLIIIGSHGYNRWERLLIGSVSDSVVHHAHCSVLVVRAGSEQQQGD